MKSAGILKPNATNMKVIELATPVESKRVLFKTLTDLEALVYETDNEVLLFVYFSGKSWLSSGCIETDLGIGPFPIESKILRFAEGATNLTVWAIWDCGREQQLQVTSGTPLE